MYRVLIADDDILMREALNIMIAKDSAFKVVHMTGTGEGAVRACKEDVIDIVFMDMLMPGMTGLEASRIIHQSNPEINIYILLPCCQYSDPQRSSQPGKGFSGKTDYIQLSEKDPGEL